MSAEESDLVLVKRVQRGDKTAFDLLVRKYQHKVVKLVLRYVRNPAEAEDIAQEAFIKAYRALPQFRGDSAFYTWMYRIAINTAKNSLASRDRSPIAYDLDLTDPEESHSVQTKLQDPDTPEGMALTEEIRGIVNSAIEGLPEELKTAIVLRELDGLSYEEIAAAMECPVGTSSPGTSNKPSLTPSTLPRGTDTSSTLLRRRSGTASICLPTVDRL